MLLVSRGRHRASARTAGRGKSARLWARCPRTSRDTSGERLRGVLGSGNPEPPATHAVRARSERTDNRLAWKVPALSLSISTAARTWRPWRAEKQRALGFAE
jgi:hypothetical protein